jgi:hypothetical protein
VAAIDAEAAHVVGMVAPHLEDVIAASLPATHPPQHQHRHPDLLREVRTVLYEYEVDRRAGAVFVAGRADRLRVPEAAQVLVPRRRLDRVLVLQQGAEHMAQEEFGVAADHVLRQPAALDQKEPVPTAGRRLLVDRLETVERRHDVKLRAARDLVGMVAQ